MNKKMRELLTKIETKQNMAKGYMEGENKDIAKAKEILDEIKTLKEEYEVEKEIFESEKETNQLSEEETKEISNKIEDKKENKNEETTKVFAKAVRGLVTKTLSEGVAADGGYTVPEDIVTKVEELRETRESLIDLVTVKNVKTNKGQETYKKRSQITGFTSIGEGGKIPRAGKLQFSRIKWEITKYGGYMPVTNELIEDSDEEIQNMMTEWLADESRVTRNNIILAVIAEKTPIKLNGLDDIKKVLNVILGSKFKSTSKIITNDDGLQYLDTLKDSDGKYLLQSNPTNPMELRLCAGATTVPVKVYSNDTIPTKENKIPFTIGDLKEGIKFYDRRQLSLMVSQTAVVGEGEDALNAFEEDLTLIRGIEREDARMRDDEAFVNGYIEITTAKTPETNTEAGSGKQENPETQGV